MSIVLHNSMTRQNEPFVPSVPDRVTMYVCGPTVYDTPHLGNARPAVVFDVLYRLLRANFSCVEYARNFTDVDDKIMDRAKANGEDIASLTARTIAEYHEVISALNILRPTYEPRATDFILPMKGQIAELLMSGYAYVQDGHVLFDTAAWSSHGKLSQHKQEDLDAGHRVAVADYKRNAGDFVMWKPSSEDQPGWHSLWGRGRPGWHIECSSMISSIFADQTIDVHGGGADLRFPHHDCEISQFEASHDGRPLANYWLHNAMVRVNGMKMAKSDGNFVTVRRAMETHPPAVIRLALLMAHYRSPLDWNDRLLSQTSKMLSTWHRTLQDVDTVAEHNGYAETVLTALEADLNTPLAIARLHALTPELVGEDRANVARGMRYAAEMIGLDLLPEANHQYLHGSSMTGDIERIIAERAEARKNRDYALSDSLRDKLTAMGVIIEDGPQGTSWRIM